MLLFLTFLKWNLLILFYLFVKGDSNYKVNLKIKGKEQAT